MNRLLLALLLLASPAFAQGVQQSGNVTPTHFACFITNGVIGDCGVAASPFASTGGVQPGPFCVNSGPQSGAYQSFCLNAASTGGVLSIQNFGGAPAGGISFSINGSPAGLPVVVLPTTNGDSACFSNTTGTIIDCGVPPSAVSSVSNSDGSLTISPTTGMVIASIGPGTPTNNGRVVLTSGNVLTTDCNHLLQLGAPITLTLPAVSGFATNCRVDFKNTSVSRGVTLSGFPSDFRATIYPLQSGCVQIVAGAWASCGVPGLWPITGAQNFFVNPTSGSATADGLNSTAAITVERAIAVLAQDLDIQGSGTVTFNYAVGNWTDHPFVSQGYHGSGTVIINGPGVNSAVCTVATVAECFGFAQSSASFGNNGCGQYVVQGFGINSTNDAAFGIFVQGACVRLSYGTMASWGFPGGAFLGMNQLSAVKSNGSNIYLGGGNYLAQVVDQANLHFTAGASSEICNNLGVTVTIASPAIFAASFHHFSVGTPITFITSGALPTGLTSGTTYFVISAGLTSSQFEVSTSPGGSAVNTSGTQSGSQFTAPAYVTEVLNGHGLALIGTTASQWTGNCFGQRYGMELMSLLDTGGSSTSMPGSSAGVPVAGVDTTVGSLGFVN